MQVEMMHDKMYIRLNPIKAQSKRIERVDGTNVDLELPEVRSRETRIAKVLAVGPEAAEAGFDEGDLVVVTFMAGTVLHFAEYDITDDTHRIIGWREVLCKIIEDKEDKKEE